MLTNTIEHAFVLTRLSKEENLIFCEGKALVQVKAVVFTEEFRCISVLNSFINFI